MGRRSPVNGLEVSRREADAVPLSKRRIPGSCNRPAATREPSLAHCWRISEAWSGTPPERKSYIQTGECAVNVFIIGRVEGTP